MNFIRMLNDWFNDNIVEAHYIAPLHRTSRFENSINRTRIDRKGIS